MTFLCLLFLVTWTSRWSALCLAGRLEFLSKRPQRCVLQTKVSILFTLSQESLEEGFKVDNENEGRDVPECSLSSCFNIYREESNMTYLLHIEDDGEGEGGNARQESKINVDYDALEVSAA
ncbi:hypothetical protein P692DRAFT_20815175 [Suillus brevipes Sb2]|nr:hypothetical protein P692DRAFT_20815175 [Suillus brevipes Sb2]